MIRCILFSCSLIVSISAFAMDESSQWVKAIKNATIASVERTFDGGYVAIGNKVVNKSNEVLVVRLNSAGKVQWAKTYGGTQRQVGSTILQTVDGGFLFSGTRPGKSYLVKVDPAGNILWQKIYMQPRMAAPYPGRLLQAADGGFFLVGSAVLKLNPDGTILWQKIYGAYGDVAAATNDGGLVLARSSGELLLSAKIGPAGSITWQKAYRVSVKKYPDANYHAVSAWTISTTADGGYVVGGEHRQGCHRRWSCWWDSNTGLVVKLDSKGKALWQTSLYSRSEDHPKSSVTSLRQEKDGHILAMGTADTTSTDEGIWSARLDSTGNVFWQNMFGEPPGTASDSITAIHDTPDDGTVFVGDRWPYWERRDDGLIGRTTPVGRVCGQFTLPVNMTAETVSIETKPAHSSVRNGKYAQSTAYFVQAPVKLTIKDLCSASSK